VRDRSGKAMHSWRVLLLPKYELKRLYDRYDFNEPWNGLHNREFIGEMPEYTYDCTYLEHRKGKTNYVAVTGDGTVWPNEGGFRTGKFVGGPAPKWMMTIWVLELNGSDIDWTEPRDLTVKEAIAYIQGRESSAWKRPSRVFGITGSAKRVDVPVTASTEVLEALFSTDESKVIPYKNDGEIDFGG
jgi:hypothetical protein